MVKRPPDAKHNSCLDYYSLNMTSTTSLIPNESASDYVQTITGAVFAGVHEAELASRHSALVIRWTDAFFDGEDFRDVWDYSSETDSLAHVLMKPKSPEFRQNVQTQFNVRIGDVLYLDRIEVLPNFRGKCLGLALAAKLIELFGRGCSLVACTVGPLQFDGHYQSNSKERRELNLDGFEPDPERAAIKLTNYWKKLGFEPISQTMPHLAIRPKEVRLIPRDIARPIDRVSRS